MHSTQSHTPVRRHFLKRQGLIIVAVTIAAIVAGGAASYTRAKVYQASTKIVVGQGGGVFNPQFGNVIQPFTQTMSSLLKSEIVADTVVRNLGLPQKPKAVLGHLHVSSTPDSAVLEVSYDSGHPATAVRTLNEIATVFTSLVRQKLGKQPGSGQTPPPAITATVFDPAHASSKPISPRPVRTMVIAGVLGLALGVILALLRNSLRDRDSRPADEIRSSPDERETLPEQIPQGTASS